MGKTARLFVIVASVNLVACVHRIPVGPEAHWQYGAIQRKQVGVDTTTDSSHVRDTSWVTLPRTPLLGLSQNYTLIDRPEAQNMIEQLACSSPADSSAFVQRMRAVEDSFRLHVPANDYREQLHRDTLVLQSWNAQMRSWLSSRSNAVASCKYNLGPVDQRIVTFTDPSGLPPSSLRTHQDNSRRIGENTGFRDVPTGWHSREQVISEANDPKVQERIKACAARNHINDDLTQEYIDSLKAGHFQWIPATGVASYNLPCGDMPWGRSIYYKPDRGEPVIYMAQVTVHGPYGGTKIDAFGSCANMYFPAQSVEFFVPRWPKPTFTPNPRYAQFRDSTWIPQQYLTTYSMPPCFGGITNALIPHPQNAVQRFGKVVMYGVEVGACGCLAEIGIAAATQGRTDLGPCARRKKEVVCPPTDKCGDISRPGTPSDHSLGAESQYYYRVAPDWVVDDQPQGVELPIRRRISIPIAQIKVPF